MINFEITPLSLLLSYLAEAMIEPRKTEQCVPSCVNVTCVTSTRKTRKSPDVPLTYERDGN